MVKIECKIKRADKQEPKRQAKTSHAAELTSCPYKRALEAAKAQASASRPRPKKRDTKKSFGCES